MMDSGSSSAWRNAPPLPTVGGTFARRLRRPPLHVRRLARYRSLPVPRPMSRFVLPAAPVGPERSVSSLMPRPLAWARWLVSRARRLRMFPVSHRQTAAEGHSPFSRPTEPLAPPTHQVRNIHFPRDESPAHLTTPRPVAHPASALTPEVIGPSKRNANVEDPAGPVVRIDPGAESRQRFVGDLSQAPRGRTIPNWMRPLARAITGSESIARISTGQTSRAALRRAGKPAATLGRTIHMRSAPDRSSPRSLGVVAHELAHVAEATHRRKTAPATPRFFGDSLFDAAESTARSVGRQAEGAARGAVGTVRSAASDIAGQAAAGAQRSVASLPVAGLGAAAAAAGALSSMQDQTAGLLSSLQSTGTALASEGLSSAGGAASGVLDDLGDTASGMVEGAASAGRGALGELGEEAGEAAGAAVSTLGGIGNSVLSAAQDPASQLIDLVDALEERVLAEIERRGGRYAEMF